MKLGFKNLKCSEVDVLVVSLFEDRLTTANEQLNKTIKFYKDKDIFKGKKGQVANFTREISDKVQNVILIGLGKSENIDLEILRKTAGKALKNVKALKPKTVVFRIPEIEGIAISEVSKSISYGLLLSDYDFDKYKTDKKDSEEINISINLHGATEDQIAEANTGIEEGTVIAEGVIIARDLVNEPANVIYPETLAEEAKKVGLESGFEVEVFDKDKILELKMEAFYSVAKASKNEPKFIVMRYTGDVDNSDKRLGLVGKGLTYDSGGYSIKPSNGMETMKSDMGGAASVIGALSVIAKRKLKTNVVAVIAACENLIDGNGYKPGDIIGSMAGKTIEVLNTDAEGRLTLADAVHYIIENEKVEKVIDVATLTGAALVALGETTTAVITNNDDFYGELVEASKITGERFWQLPAFEEYKKLIKSDIADLKNIGGRYAGTITAGLFIGEFVQEKPWLHLDIAGTSWASANGDYCIKGGTGAPVSTLYQLVKNDLK